MRRITPRTCLWPLIGCVSGAFVLSLGLTFRSNHHCYAGTCGETLFTLQARLHVVVWYAWISLSIGFLGLRAFQPAVRRLTSLSLGWQVPIIGKTLRVGGLLLILWVLSLYGILFGIWWIRLRNYFTDRGGDLPGNTIVAAVAQTGHLADVTMGMVLLPVSRHSALVSFFKLSPTTTYTFHMFQAYVLFVLVAVHGSLYADWASIWDARFRLILPILNPTYYYNETWPGNRSSLGVWRASLIFTGIASSLIMVLILFSSLPIIRRKWFNVFYFCHLLAIVAVVIICLHASTMFYCTLPGLAMWLLDWSMRFLELGEKLDSQLTALGNGWYSLKLPLPRKRLSGCACHSPLAHFHIHHSDSSVLEIHPFTTITHLASKKSSVAKSDSIEIEFLFRQMPERRPGKSTQWTNRVGSLVPAEASRLPSVQNRDIEKAQPVNTSALATSANLSVETMMRLEGPYFTPANPERYETVICIVAGTGVSGALAIAAAFQSEMLGSLWKRCVVIWTVRETDFVDLPSVAGIDHEGFEFKVHKTGKGLPRLDVRKALVEICGEDTKSTWCYISGPNAFISAAEQACNRVRGLEIFAARWD